MQNSGEPSRPDRHDGLYQTNSQLSERGGQDRFVLEHSLYQQAKLHPALTTTIAVAGGNAKGLVVSTGNPHFVEFVEQFPARWQARAGAIGQSREFPQGTNVELVRVLGRNKIEFRIFERGAGETQSSGTGSCASAIAAIHNGFVSSPVEVQAPGGTQVVQWDRADALLLEGPARLVCRGEFLL